MSEGLDAENGSREVPGWDASGDVFSRVQLPDSMCLCVCVCVDVIPYFDNDDNRSKGGFKIPVNTEISRALLRCSRVMLLSAAVLLGGESERQSARRIAHPKTVLWCQNLILLK